MHGVLKQSEQGSSNQTGKEVSVKGTEGVSRALSFDHVFYCLGRFTTKNSSLNVNNTDGIGAGSAL